MSGDDVNELGEERATTSPDPTDSPHTVILTT